jgi:rRNA maturation endonuclease Nob1
MNGTCVWTFVDSDEFWDTSCGQGFCFDHDGPKENKYHFCPHCGKPIELKHVETQKDE